MASVEAFPEAMTLRLPCLICGRSFSPEVLERHERICEKTAQKKRKTFVSAQQRIQGTEMTYTPPAPVSALKQTPPAAAAAPPRPTPKRVAARAFLRPTANALVQCSFCNRNFSEKAAERHVPWCRELKARLPRSPPSYVARCRLTTRVNYKAPLPGKRRGVTTPPTRPRRRQTPPPPLTSGAAVSVTGTSIWRLPPKQTTTTSGSELSLSNGGGLIPSTSWEYFGGGGAVAAPEVPLHQKRSGSCPNGSDYDPFEAAQRQQEVLRLQRPLSPELSPAAYRKRRDDAGSVLLPPAWFSDDDDVISDSFPLPALVTPPPTRFRRRRAVSRDEALFGSGSKNSSLDSDYGSLLRRSPPAACRRVSAADTTLSPACSRSSSETSLPAALLPPQAKFCHECGAKYPLRGARFCCECGIRRLCIA